MAQLDMTEQMSMKQIKQPINQLTIFYFVQKQIQQCKLVNLGPNLITSIKLPGTDLLIPNYTNIEKIKMIGC